jgi:uncharacterized protein (DUF58 family)
MAESLLDPEFMTQLEYLYVVTKDLFIGHFAAQRISRKFGVGQEFADFRSYSQGDDYRHIDWATYARRDALVVRLFAEEQELPIYIAIDASRSMGCGSPEKLLFAKKIAAALSYIGVANLDPVSIVPFDAQLRPSSRQFQGRGQVRPMIAFLEEIQANGRTDLGAAFREFVRRHPRRGVVVVLSDFFDRAGYEEAIRLLHYHRFDLLAVQVNDRDEIEPKLTADMELVDSETSERVTVRLTPGLIEGYLERLQDHYAELNRLCRLLGRTHIAAVSDTPFEQLIFEAFRRGGFLR